MDKYGNNITPDLRAGNQEGLQGATNLIQAYQLSNQPYNVLDTLVKTLNVEIKLQNLQTGVVERTTGHKTPRGILFKTNSWHPDVIVIDNSDTEKPGYVLRRLLGYLHYENVHGEGKPGAYILSYENKEDTFADGYSIGFERNFRAVLPSI